jgi:hypothetical protein
VQPVPYVAVERARYTHKVPGLSRCAVLSPRDGRVLRMCAPPMLHRVATLCSTQLCMHVLSPLALQHYKRNSHLYQMEVGNQVGNLHLWR